MNPVGRPDSSGSSGGVRRSESEHSHRRKKPGRTRPSESRRSALSSPLTSAFTNNDPPGRRSVLVVTVPEFNCDRAELFRLRLTHSDPQVLETIRVGRPATG